ncbi:hypothetical protein AWR41_01745 [Riemerella anatipestifer]|uniref:hypothetical protein n=1 Tax=Riemerella anatipestifer TaxID=34085 RepID=UPI00056F1409|nr:hypothetical protein [Riemerella anatipestifer]MDD1552929.1 hypothetical protein [Riemerella anatipestifer]MDD1595055.1 hypothetical protein [Riemerella anatipestifer]MDY3334407.1 hypothetical protein [Riemerella anatipestifer]MDY3380654.1 hypothetical protein [Riemerella anatipestifer]MDY3384829.1 hypothetical protein [Riemerella anatipestifer]
MKILIVHFKIGYLMYRNGILSLKMDNDHTGMIFYRLGMNKDHFLVSVHNVPQVKNRISELKIRYTTALKSLSLHYASDNTYI